MRITESKIYGYIHEALLVAGRGVGQVMFQKNAWSGWLMLAGIACSSWQLALLALLGNAVGTATAFALGYSREDIRDGLYGFNGTLVGIAVGVFLEPGVVPLCLLVLASALSTCIAWLFGRQRVLPGFTAPFILSVWILLAVCRLLNPAWLLSAEPSAVGGTADYLQAFCLNVGQVMFQGGSIWSGVLFLLAILIHSRLNAVYTVLGALLPLLMAFLPQVDYTAFNAGLFGYNAVLCSIALGDKSLRGAVLAVVSILLSVLLQLGGMHCGVVTLTAPFVLSVWITMALGNFGTHSKT